MSRMEPAKDEPNSSRILQRDTALPSPSTEIPFIYQTNILMTNISLAQLFDLFCAAGSLKHILGLFREMCKILNMKPAKFPEFYPKFKEKLKSSWKAQAVCKKLDIRANQKVYIKGKACTQNKVLVIGAGPCGLRVAIECQLLGAKVVVIEKRDRMTRNNVVHLWPFTIQDLRGLGAKKFLGKFCAGSIDHISIRQLQFILLKVALLLGVEFYEGVSFENLLEPTNNENAERLGWRADVSPADHPVSQYEFDVLFGADGKRNTLKGFSRKEFRCKLAIGVTANFINRHTEQEASVPEISGVSFIFNQQFFKDLNEEKGIDLENIVYYKDDTHYFVMTVKKQSLLEKEVLRMDYPEISKLLSVENVDRSALFRYAREAATFATKGELPVNDFALNHYGEPDVALFDFTNMYAAENASMVYERFGRRLLCQLVGDSLMEPFWPTGSGCARGFLSALDGAWAVRAWGQNPPPHPLEVIAERESIYRLLGHANPDNLHRPDGFTVDPGTRYPNLNRLAVTPQRVVSFYKSDDPLPLNAPVSTRKRRREPSVSDEVLVKWVCGNNCDGGLYAAILPGNLAALVRRYRPDLLPISVADTSVYEALHRNYGIPPMSTSPSKKVDGPDSKIRIYVTRVYNAFKGEVPHTNYESDVIKQIKDSQMKDKRKPVQDDLLLYSNPSPIKKDDPCSQYFCSHQSDEEGRLVGGDKITSGVGVNVARIAAELAGEKPAASNPSLKPKDLLRSVGRLERDDWHIKKIERKMNENRLGRPCPGTPEKVPKWDRAQFLGRCKRLKEGDGANEKWVDIDETLQKLNQQLHDSGRPHQGSQRVAALATKFVNPEKNSVLHSTPKPRGWRSPAVTGKHCAACNRQVFAAESVTADGLHLHRACFRCAICKGVLRPGSYTRKLYGGADLVCLRHSGTDVSDALLQSSAQSVSKTPERISFEGHNRFAKEIDEDEWTDLNFLASETSGAGGDENESSSDECVEDSDTEEDEPVNPPPGNSGLDNTILNDTNHALYFSADSFGYDDFTDDDSESSGGESGSRMQAAREARRREVPQHTRPPTGSSEVESEDEDSEPSDDEVSSATEVSTDSEFACEECAPVPSPPAITVTEAPPPATPPSQDYPLSRTRSASGIATKRALELKRRYLLGEPSPPSVRRSDSTSRLDTKFEAFRFNISEFQKLLNPAPLPQEHVPNVAFRLSTDIKILPDINKNLCSNTVNSLATSELHKRQNKTHTVDAPAETNNKANSSDLESDSLSDNDSSKTKTAPNQSVPRVEIHNDSGELIQLDSLTITNNNNDIVKDLEPCVLVSDNINQESESSESCKEVTTLALTETELSDWAADSSVLEYYGIEDKIENNRNKVSVKSPRSLSGPKVIYDTKNSATVTGHICGKNESTPTPVVYSNALEHFEFADEGEEDPSIEIIKTPRNDGYMEFIENFFEDCAHSPMNDRSMNFIESRPTETLVTPLVNVDLNSVEDSEALQMSCDIPSLEKQENINIDETIYQRPLPFIPHLSPCCSGPNSLQLSNDCNNLTMDNLNFSSNPSLICDETPVVEGCMILERTCDSFEFEDENLKCQNNLNNSITTVQSSTQESSLSSPDLNSLKLSKETNFDCLFPNFQSPNSTLEIGSESIRDVKNLNTELFSQNHAVNGENINNPKLHLNNAMKKHDVDIANDVQTKFISLNTDCNENSNLEILQNAEKKEKSENSYHLNVESIPTNGLKNDYSSLLRINILSPTCNSNFSASDTPHQNVNSKIFVQFNSEHKLPVIKKHGDVSKAHEIKREREEQTEVVRRLVMERLGSSGNRVNRKSSRRVRPSPSTNIPPPVPPPPVLPLEQDLSPQKIMLQRSAPTHLTPSQLAPSFSDPELTRERRHSGIIRSLSNYFNTRLRTRSKSESEMYLTAHESPNSRERAAHSSSPKEPQQEVAPPIPPPPRNYPGTHRQANPGCREEWEKIDKFDLGRDEEERDVMQLWFETRWSRLVAQRRQRDTVSPSPDAVIARRVVRLERRLRRPLSAEQQATAVAELVQVSAQHDAHQAMLAADRSRNAASGKHK